jgi:hypothetical protein
MAQEPNAVPEETGDAKSAASKLFDIRLMIGGLFVVYGVLLTIYGFFTSEAELQKAAGININLWLGLGMLVLGALFLVWMKVNPLVPPDPSTIDMDRPPAH